MTVNEFIDVLNTDINKRTSHGAERIVGLSVNGKCVGYVKSAKMDGHGSGLTADVCYNAIQTIGELQEQIPKWHLCSEELPRNCDNRWYLCIAENHEDDCPMTLQYEEDYGFGWWNNIYDGDTLGFVDSEFHSVKDEHIEEVIAWMELPKFEEME